MVWIERIIRLSNHVNYWFIEGIAISEYFPILISFKTQSCPKENSIYFLPLDLISKRVFSIMLYVQVKQNFNVQ